MSDMGLCYLHSKVSDQDIPDHLIRYFLNRSFVSPLIFLTFINLQVAQYFWVLILPGNIIIYMKHIPHLRRL